MSECVCQLLACNFVIHVVKLKNCLAIACFIGCCFPVFAENQDSLSTKIIVATPAEKPFKPDLKLIRLESINGISPSDSLQKLKLPPVPLGFFCKFEDIMQQKWKIPLNLELK